MPPAVEVVAPRLVDPAPPAPLRLEPVHWRECHEVGEVMHCVDHRNAKAIVRNKIATGRWIAKAAGVIRFYRDANANAGAAK